MFLDSNGDGANTGEDRLSTNGVTIVDVWIDTMHDGSGWTAVCNSGGEGLTINSYVFNLQAIGGTVTYSGFLNRRADMNTSFGEMNPGDGSYKNGAGGSTLDPPGLYQLATLAVEVLDGSPSLEIVNFAQGSSEPTSFGSQCAGVGADNTYTLGVDWSDTAGLIGLGGLGGSAPILSDAPPDSTPDTTMPTPPPAPGGNQTGLQYCRVKLPRPGFRVVAKYYDGSCPNGGLCDTEIYTAGSTDTCAWVPTAYPISPFAYVWWGKVRMEFPTITPWGFFENDLQVPIELNCDSQPEDRLQNYTVNATIRASEILILDILRKTQAVSEDVFGDSRASIQVNWSNDIHYGNDEIHIADPGYYVATYGASQWLNSLTTDLRHEYGHALYYEHFGGPGLCTRDQHSIWDYVTSDCAPHNGCTTGLSDTGGFSEGWAQAYAWAITRIADNQPIGPPWFGTCWQMQAGLYGPTRDLNVAPFFFHLMAFDTRAVFNVLRYGRIVEAGGQWHPPTTLIQFLSLWQDENLESNRYIGVHQRGPLNAEALYYHYMYGPTATGVETIEQAGLPEGEDLRWIRSVFPTPARPSGTLRIRAVVPSSREVRLSIYDASGRRLRIQQYSGLDLGEQELELPLPMTLSSGVYLLLFEDAGQRGAKDSSKFIVLK